MILMLKESSMRKFCNYYVKPIVNISTFDYDRKWGVFAKRPEDTTKIHCKDEDANLILWVYDEIVAYKIAELLDVDDYMHETENN